MHFFIWERNASTRLGGFIYFAYFFMDLGKSHSTNENTRIPTVCLRVHKAPAPQQIITSLHQPVTGRPRATAGGSGGVRRTDRLTVEAANPGRGVPSLPPHVVTPRQLTGAAAPPAATPWRLRRRGAAGRVSCLSGPAARQKAPLARLLSAPFTRAAWKSVRPREPRPMTLTEVSRSRHSPPTQTDRKNAHCTTCFNKILSAFHTSHVSRRILEPTWKVRCITNIKCFQDSRDHKEISHIQYLNSQQINKRSSSQNTTQEPDNRYKIGHKIESILFRFIWVIPSRHDYPNGERIGDIIIIIFEV